MANIHTIRSGDSPLVNAITRSVATDNGVETILPDGRWDLIVIRNEDGKPMVFLLNSPSTQATRAAYATGQEALVVTFETGSYIDTGSILDRRSMHQLEVIGENKFKIGSEVLEIPTFQNADTFADVLQRKELLKVDEVVDSVVHGRQRAQTDRTLQRHFKDVTGMSPHKYQQIMRALRAMELIKAGQPAIVVAHELGFTDQFHLSKALKQILGQTPSEMNK